MRFGRLTLLCRCAALLAAASLAGAAGVAQVERGRTPELGLSDPSYGKIIVAEVGGVKITAQEFLLSYSFGPAFTKREADSKRRYLEFMINEKLFALDGYARGLQRSERARDALREVEGDLATEELYKEDVAKRVVVTPEEVSEGVRRKRVEVALQWLFAPTESGIAASEKRLRAGAGFDSLYALELSRGVPAEDRSLRTTLFDLRMKNPVLAKIVDSLQAGAVSLPIHVDDGWYIVRVTERARSAITTESEAAQQRADVRRALVQRTSDKLSDEYVNQILADAKATINRRAFDIVQTYLASRTVPEDKFRSWRMAALLAEKWGPIGFRDIAPFRAETIVTYRRGKITVGDFLRWYDARATGINLPSASEESFFAALEGIVWRMVRDTLLVERAFERRLQFAGTVQQQKKWWEEKVLYELAKSMIRDSIPVDEAKLREYYARHARDYRDSAGQVQPYDRVADDVRREYYAGALTERMLHRVLALKSRFTVTVNEAALKRLPAEGEDDPGAIDVYAVKKGGTFPRPAFPTIDYGWQSWE